MDIFKLIHKIRNLTIDDKIKIAKKASLFFIAGVIVLTITIAGVKAVIKIFNSTNNEEIYISGDEEFEHLPELEIEENKEAEFSKPSSQQKEEFNLYNCLQFSDITQKDGVISFKVKNTSNFTIKSLSLDLYNESKQLVTTISLPIDKKLEPNDEVYVDGFVNETVSVKLYSYFKGKDFITINLFNNSALTGDNDIGTVF